MDFKLLLNIDDGKTVPRSRQQIGLISRMSRGRRNGELRFWEDFREIAESQGQGEREDHPRFQFLYKSIPRLHEVIRTELPRRIHELLIAQLAPVVDVPADYVFRYL